MGDDPIAKPPSSRSLGENTVTLLYVGGSACLGLLLGVLIPGDADLPDPWRMISSIIGWTYFSAWTLSFWPQAVYNTMRRSVAGLALDFVLLNWVGFLCYGIYTGALYYSPAVQAAYAEQYGSSNSDVQLNDVGFAAHAFLLSTVIGAQSLIYDRGGNRISTWVVYALGGTTVVVGVFSVLAVSPEPSFQPFVPLNILSALAFVKVGITMVKYTPQIVLHFRRKSTEGWSVQQFVLDFMGGSLSLGQLLLDCAVLGDWTALTGNVAKTLLGGLSILFDVVLLVQHYVLYRKPHQQSEEEARLIGGQLHSNNHDVEA